MKMVYLWILLLCISLTKTEVFYWTESDVGLLIKENIETFKAHLHKKLVKINVNPPLLQRRQSSKKELYLNSCVDLLEGHLENAQQKIDTARSKMKNVWIASNTVKIPSLKVNGKVFARGRSKIRQLDVKINVSSPLSFDKIITKIGNRVKSMKKDLSKTLSKSHKQYIKSKIILKNVTVAKGTISELNSHVIVNKLSTNRLTSTLRRKGNQKIPNKVLITNLSCRKSFVGSLNRNKIEDFIRLNTDSLTLTGSFVFRNILAKTVSVNGRLNGQKTDNFVLISKDQEIYGLKEFQGLSVNNVATGLVGEITLDNLKKAKEDSANFPSSLNFLSNVVIQGNLNLYSLNGIDIMQLFYNAVKTNENQKIAGKKIFKSTVFARSVTLAGKVNSCKLDQLMTINTNQPIYADVKFPRFNVFGNIVTDFINGIDLSRQALIRSRNSLIRGMKTFAKTLKVSNIYLKEGILIDYFDPSKEKFQIIKNTDIETWESYWLDSIIIGNINATDVEIDSKYFPQLKNLGNVWLRTTEQNIPVIEAKNMQLNGLKVSRVNNIAIEDLVTVEGISTVEAPVHFLEEVFTKTLNLGNKSNVNFSPEYWNGAKVKISNNITFEKAVLKRNLTVAGSLKNFESGFMQVKDKQTINNSLKFEKVKVESLCLKDLNFSKINNINLADFLNRAVVVPIGNKTVQNKQFKALTGSAIIINGTLNKVSLNKIALKNAPQKMSPWMFMKGPSFKKIHAKNLLDGIQLENIVYTDEYGVICNKQFNGTVSAAHLNASGSINDVNVSNLQREAFNKTKENYVKGNLIFYGNVTTNEIQISANKIDNINLDDVMYLDESTNLNSLNASDVAMQNLFVDGRINGCDIKSIVENAFTRHDTKTVTARTIAKSLVIEGNLKINYMTGERFADWISFLKMTSAVEIERNLEFERLNADNINLYSLNGAILDSLIDDAVKKYESKPMHGRKFFQEVIIAQRSSVQQLNSYRTCGMNITEMFDSYINKTENRTSNLLNSYMKSLAARQVSVRGVLNDLKLPSDVVLSNVSEIIKPDMYFSNTTNASMGLVIYGKINGIKLENFLTKRISLNTSQGISSTLNFTENIVLRGNTGLNGTINNIRLENALKKRPNQTITGITHFNDNLEISADVTVNGSIGGAYFDRFLRSSINESAKEVQFSRLSTFDLNCDTINGVNILNFYNYTHTVVHDTNEKLDELTYDILLLQDSLRDQRDAVEHALFLFSYFELYEIIKFGPVLKFLPVYEYGMIGEKYELQVTQMVMWVNKKGKGCRKMKSVIADVSMNGTFTNVTKVMKGRVYPFSLQAEREDVVGFYVQAEHSRKCSPEIKSLIIKTIFSSAYINNSKISLPAGAILIDVQLLDLNDIFLIVALNIKDPGDRIFIYIYDAFNNSWSHHQQFHSQSLTSLEFVSIERDAASLFEQPDVYLSVTGDGKNSGINVYEWDIDTEEFYLKTNLSTTASTHALWLYAHRNLYLFLAKEMTEIQRNHTKVSAFNEPLEIYTFDDDELVLNHIVNIKGIRYIDSFTLSGEVFILATSSYMEVVYVLQFRGYNGFEVIQEIAAPGVTEARVFSVDTNLYLALNSRTVPSRILKASIRGGKFFAD